MNVRVEARSDDGSAFVREAVVLRLPFPKRSYTFLRWQEGGALTSSVLPPGPNPVPSTPAPANNS